MCWWWERRHRWWYMMWRQLHKGGATMEPGSFHESWLCDWDFSSSSSCWWFSSVYLGCRSKYQWTGPTNSWSFLVFHHIHDSLILSHRCVGKRRPLLQRSPWRLASQDFMNSRFAGRSQSFSHHRHDGCNWSSSFANNARTTPSMAFDPGATILCGWGVNVIAFGQLPGIEQPVCVVGGNCSVQADKGWSPKRINIRWRRQPATMGL